MIQQSITDGEWISHWLLQQNNNLLGRLEKTVDHHKRLHHMKIAAGAAKHQNPSINDTNYIVLLLKLVGLLKIISALLLLTKMKNLIRLSSFLDSWSLYQFSVSSCCVRFCNYVYWFPPLMFPSGISIQGWLLFIGSSVIVMMNSYRSFLRRASVLPHWKPEPR